MDGIGLLERVRQKYPRLPIIVVSAIHDSSVAAAAMRVGASDYLTKPFESYELLTRIHNVLAKDCGWLQRVALTVNHPSPTTRTALLTAKLLAAVFLLVAFVSIVSDTAQWYDDYRFNRLSPSEHLTLARKLCSNEFADPCFQPNVTEAERHLEKIPATAPEYATAAVLLKSIRQQAIRHEQAVAAAEARQRVAEQEAQRKSAADQEARAQQTRDADAELSSYWPTTLRVDTDMDSFWLNNEERVCKTYPNDKGRVSVVACNETGNHRIRNIPVTFWGGVDRKTVSEWKCRRERDDFACRAVN
jgi:DNA-binding response OmpR family regulator